MAAPLLHYEDFSRDTSTVFSTMMLCVGSIPKELGDLSKLKGLWLSKNQLAGESTLSDPLGVSQLPVAMLIRTTPSAC